MIGTVVNAAAVMTGGFIGVALKRFISQEIRNILLKVVGLCVSIIGIIGLIETMIHVDLDTGKLTSNGGIIIMVSMVLGVIVGEKLKIDKGLSRLGKKIETQFKLKDNFSHAFIEASILYCIGAMAIVGAMNEGIYGDSSFLMIKSSFDFVTSLILACTLGIGVSFSAISILLYQGLLTIFAQLVSEYVPEYFINNISMVGYAIVLGIGINFIVELKIKFANTLPALVFAVIVTFFL